MTIVMQPIYTQNVSNSSVSSVVFNNIPQTFTDLKIVFSMRVDVANLSGACVVRFNGDTGINYSNTYFYGYSTALYSSRDSNASSVFLGYTNGATSTASVFGSTEAYIPNYTSSTFKSFTSESSPENNALQAAPTLSAGLWRNTSSITSVSIFGNGNILQHSTITIYGITKG